MSTKNDIDTRIHRICMLLHTTEDEMLMLGKALLTLFRDVFRNTRLDADDMVEMLCSDSEESEEDKRMSEALTRLEFFATEGTRLRYEAEIESILQTGWLLRVMEGVLFTDILSAFHHGAGMGHAGGHPKEHRDAALFRVVKGGARHGIGLRLVGGFKDGHHGKGPVEAGILLVL